MKTRTLNSGTTGEISDDLFVGCQPLNPEPIFLWNRFLLKRGWLDSVTPRIGAGKTAGSFDRAAGQTYAGMHDIDKGRQPLAVPV